MTQTFAASLGKRVFFFFFEILAFPSAISDATLQDAHENGDGKPSSVSCFAN